MSLKIEGQKIETDKKISSVDPEMICFRNSLEQLEKNITQLTGQYRNADEELDIAIHDLINAYKDVVRAAKASRRDCATINDYVAYVRPDFVSVNDADGMTPGTATVESVHVDVDNDGVHMYVNIK